jgi:hypothetical protein
MLAATTRREGNIMIVKEGHPAVSPVPMEQLWASSNNSPRRLKRAGYIGQTDRSACEAAHLLRKLLLSNIGSSPNE